MKIKIILVIFATIVLSSCSQIQDHINSQKTYNLEYDSESLFFRAPDGYCFYNDLNELESAILKIEKEANDTNHQSMQLAFQNCKEKREFLENKKILFRNIGAIYFATDRELNILKKYKLNIDREKYVKIVHESSNIESTKDFESRINSEYVVMFKKHKNLKIIDESNLLSDLQKDEMKSAHGEIFKNYRHQVLYHETELEQGFAAYEYYESKVGSNHYICTSSTTLIHFIPTTIYICNDYEKEKLDLLKNQIKLFTHFVIRENAV